MLPFFIYGRSTLWNVFGDILVENLKAKLNNTILCERCGKREEKTRQRQKLCLHCLEINKKEKALDLRQVFGHKKIKFFCTTTIHALFHIPSRLSK